METFIYTIYGWKTPWHDNYDTMVSPDDDEIGGLTFGVV